MAEKTLLPASNGRWSHDLSQRIEHRGPCPLETLETEQRHLRERSVDMRRDEEAVSDES